MGISVSWKNNSKFIKNEVYRERDSCQAKRFQQEEKCEWTIKVVEIQKITKLAIINLERL
jgi:hypothetical protein